MNLLKNKLNIKKNTGLFQYAFIGITILSFVVWLALIFAQGDASKQFDIFFHRVTDFFADTLNVVGYSSGRDVYHNTMYLGLQEKAYPPLTYMMMYCFSRLISMDKYYAADFFLGMYTEPKFLIMYLIYATVGIVMVYELVRTCKKGANTVKIWTAAAICLSAPIIYSYERANTIILTLFCVMLYIFYYDSKNKIMRELALIGLAVAVAFKMTPAILGLLLLYDRKWKEAIRAVIYGIIVGIGPFFFFEGGLSNLTQMFHNMGMNVDQYVSSEGCTLYASTLSLGFSTSKGLDTAMKVITILVCLILVVAGIMYRNRWEMIMAVSLVLIILPSHSGQYCILYIIPAAIAFLNAEEYRYTDWFVLIALLMIMFNIQSTFTQKFFSYHTGILILTVVLTIRGIIGIYQLIKIRKLPVQC